MNATTARQQNALDRSQEFAGAFTCKPVATRVRPAKYTPKEKGLFATILSLLVG